MFREPTGGGALWTAALVLAGPRARGQFQPLIRPAATFSRTGRSGSRRAFPSPCREKVAAGRMRANRDEGQPEGKPQIEMS